MADDEPASSWALGAHALLRMPDLAHVHEAVSSVSVEAPQALTEVYFDTHDLRLARWGAALLLRSGPEPRWWLRLRDGEASVPHVPTGTDLAVPGAAADMVRGLSRSAALEPVTTASILRTAHRLLDRQGDELVVVQDDTLGLAVAGIGVDRFRTLVVHAVAPAGEGAGREPSSAGLEVAAATVARLEARGAWSHPVPAVVRALGARAVDQPDIPQPPVVGPGDSAGVVLQAFFAQQGRKLLRQDVRVRADLPDAVHQMRVAARRLRSCLRAFEPLLDEDWAEGLRVELGWIAGELGLSRDSEVLLERLDEHTGALDPADAALIHASVDPHMLSQVAAGRSAALAALGSARYQELAQALVDGIAQPPFTPLADGPAEEVLAQRCAKAWRRLAKSVDGVTMQASSDRWHRTRIKAKRARYAVDAAVPVLGAGAKVLADTLSEVTELLGEHQDAHIAQLRCRELAQEFDGPTGFALGHLAAHERQRELAARGDLFLEWPRIARVASQALGE